MTTSKHTLTYISTFTLTKTKNSNPILSLNHTHLHPQNPTLKPPLTNSSQQQHHWTLRFKNFNSKTTKQWNAAFREFSNFNLKMRSSSSTSGEINIAMSAQKLDVDNRISLRFYYRIADNILRQVHNLFTLFYVDSIWDFWIFQFFWSFVVKFTYLGL